MMMNNLGYIDPGTGSMLFSIIIGVATTAVFALRGVVIKLKYKVAGGKVKINEDKIPLVIFSDSKRYWNVFKPICDKLEDAGFTAEYWTMSPDDPAISEKYEHIKCSFIGDGNGAFAKLNMMKANVCLSTTPGLDVLQWKRSKDVDCYVHIFHDVTDGTGYRMFGLDNYDAVLMSGNIQEKPLRQLEEMRNLKAKELILNGSTYMDGLKQKYDAMEHKENNSTEKVVLVAPSWGQSSILNRFGEKFIDAVIKTGYKVIIRPHPQSKTADKDLLERLQNKYPDSENFEWNYDNDNFAVLNKADVIISDFSGVIFDFAFIFDKPIIYADTDFDPSPYDAAWLDHPMWLLEVEKELGEKLDESNFDNMKEFIDGVISNDKYTQGRKNARELAWANQGESAKYAVDYLIKKFDEIKKADVKNDDKQYSK